MYFGPAFFIVMIFAFGVMIMYMTRGYRGGNRGDSAAQTLRRSVQQTPAFFVFVLVDFAMGEVLRRGKLERGGNPAAGARREAV